MGYGKDSKYGKGKGGKCYKDGKYGKGKGGKGYKGIKGGKTSKGGYYDYYTDYYGKGKGVDYYGKGKGVDYYDNDDYYSKGKGVDYYGKGKGVDYYPVDIDPVDETSECHGTGCKGKGQVIVRGKGFKGGKPRRGKYHDPYGYY